MAKSNIFEIEEIGKKPVWTIIKRLVVESMNRWKTIKNDRLFRYF